MWSAAGPCSCLEKILGGIESRHRLDRRTEVLQGVAERVDRSPAGPALRGAWLGHALHPALTDLPIGFWTSSMVLDLVGGARSRVASRRLVGWGLVSAVPTVGAGLVDWLQLTDPRKRRVGLVHAGSNAVATSCYLMSWCSRRRGRHVTGTMLGVVGGLAATVGGFLGGHLAFGTPVAGEPDAELPAWSS
jgi:uncharacterized membrane protein